MFNATGQQMNLPDDMKGFKGQEWDDPFQLLEPRTALWALVTILCMVAIIERGPG